jgi:hypothetical protein
MRALRKLQRESAASPFVSVAKSTCDHSRATSSEARNPMPEGQQDHGGVTVTVPVALGGFDKGLDFGRSEVFAGAKFGIRPAKRSNCPIFDGR